MTELEDRIHGGRGTGRAGADDREDGRAGGADTQGANGQRVRRRLRLGRRGRRRSTSLRLRLVVVFALVALTAAVSASSIAYWLNREAMLTHTQDAALSDFQQEMQSHASVLPPHPTQDELQHTAGLMADSGQHFSVLLIARDEHGRNVVGDSDLDSFDLQKVPEALREAVAEKQPVSARNSSAYRMFWQRIVDHGTPYLVGGAKVIGGGPTGYMLKSLEPEAKDLDSMAWSLGIATALALVGAALLAQAAATTVLKPVHRLGVAARRLGEGKLDTRLRVSGTDELAELSRTFNRAAESLEKRVADMSAREEASRRFVADMSHELRTPLTAITAVTEVLEEELDAETGGIDPMIEPAVRLVVSETRRLNDLVENLMEVTRFDAGTARLVLDDVDIADQITACIDARAWLDAVDLDAERGIVARLDPRRLDVILANLIGNALKHGGSPVRVAVRTERRGGAERTGSTESYEGTQPYEGARPYEGGQRYESVSPYGDAQPYGDTQPYESTPPYGDAQHDAGGRLTRSTEDVVIAVRDHGPGIPEEVLPHVFDRFYKASASRPRSDGSGLGLSIALENAHIHGGRITASNAPDGGAVFTLRLPRYTVERDDTGEAHVGAHIEGKAERDAEGTAGAGETDSRNAPHGEVETHGAGETGGNGETHGNGETGSNGEADSAGAAQADLEGGRR